MLQTVVVGSISIQGIFEKREDDGRVIVRVDNRLYAGRPVERRIN
ncbi:hypothetical protein [Phaeovulum vinaykumarii]|uniref:Uncharacterized protein n=1 Tax=Phaeovulum vinaykumarii TaxID=407234 RepID=A0A1N7KY35_9RHOB|nr:hypothetical protein [Phaeovulum vinaykumarii]SIS66461.1 hypothetical protein SAMN05421795_102297 [Phaeovulum vinaykumarii]SOC01080.1 hypothetical protein SAMN05878426_102475 [Phaeovulum vinaykumarii]